MQTTKLVIGLAFAGVMAGCVAASASDPIAVYARIERVVLEPATGAAERAQGWGTFALAKPNDGTDYLPPSRGYLYFALSRNADAARSEWADLQSVAGTGQIVSFGSRWEMRARVRTAEENPDHPDAYAVGVGVTKVRGNTSYAPIRALLDARP